MADAEEIKTFMMNLVHYCQNSGIYENFIAFFQRNADLFRDHIHERRQEHPLEFTEVYNEYCAKIEGQVEGFIEKEGITPEDFYALCKEAGELDAGFGNFIQLITAYTDYERFYKLMEGFLETGELD